jgi:DNA modification methylase
MMPTTYHRFIFGDCRRMAELDNNSIHLVVTSPPYFNAPFDYPNLFENYDDYLSFMKEVAVEIHRVLASGRIACIVCDDVLIDGKKYPVVADLTRIFIDSKFLYRDRIMWIKPEGYIRISRRSGVVLQHPYPMYFYPDNVQESILIFQRGSFNYRDIPEEQREVSKLDLPTYQGKKWYLNVWQITNVLPLSNRLEEGIAAFPEEIPRRLICLFSHAGEVVLDPFMGSGTTNKVARELRRSSVGYEVDLELLPVVKIKVGIEKRRLDEDANFEVTIREDAQHLRTGLQKEVSHKRSVASRGKRRANKS